MKNFLNLCMCVHMCMYVFYLKIGLYAIKRGLAGWRLSKVALLQSKPKGLRTMEAEGIRSCLKASRLKILKYLVHPQDTSPKYPQV